MYVRAFDMAHEFLRNIQHRELHERAPLFALCGPKVLNDAIANIQRLTDIEQFAVLRKEHVDAAAGVVALLIDLGIWPKYVAGELV